MQKPPISFLHCTTLFSWLEELKSQPKKNYILAALEQIAYGRCEVTIIRDLLV